MKSGISLIELDLVMYVAVSLRTTCTEDYAHDIHRNITYKNHTPSKAITYYF